jgi:hypothetical protein
MAQTSTPRSRSSRGELRGQRRRPGLQKPGKGFNILKPTNNAVDAVNVVEASVVSQREAYKDSDTNENPKTLH